MRALMGSLAYACMHPCTHAHTHLFYIHAVSFLVAVLRHCRLHVNFNRNRVHALLCQPMHSYPHLPQRMPASATVHACIFHNCWHASVTSICTDDQGIPLMHCETALQRSLHAYMPAAINRPLTPHTRQVPALPHGMDVHMWSSLQLIDSHALRSIIKNTTCTATSSQKEGRS